jgi:hypothetical protein
MHTKKFKYDGELLKVTQLRITKDLAKKEKENLRAALLLNGLEVYNSNKIVQNTYEYDQLSATG